MEDLGKAKVPFYTCWVRRWVCLLPVPLEVSEVVRGDDQIDQLFVSVFWSRLVSPGGGGDLPEKRTINGLPLSHNYKYFLQSSNYQIFTLGTQLGNFLTEIHHCVAVKGPVVNSNRTASTTNYYVVTVVTKSGIQKSFFGWVSSAVSVLVSSLLLLSESYYTRP